MSRTPDAHATLHAAGLRVDAASPAQAAEPDAAPAARRAKPDLLVDLDQIDLSACLADRRAIERVNPHRHEMALLDSIVWMAPDMSAAVGLLQARSDQFWVRGHFPVRATLPGVLMVEAGAQVACYLWNSRNTEPRVAAFLRIEEAAFRRAVAPGEDMFVICKALKYSVRRFVSDVQGVVNGELAFNARLSGMAMEKMPGE